MSIGSTITSAILLVIGAIIGFVPTLLIEKSKQRHALKTRWDVPLFDLCKKFIATARQLVHLARHLDRVPDRAEQLRRLDDKHVESRGLFEQIRILGSPDLQLTARMVIRHCYAVRAVAEGQKDARLKDYPGTTPEQRVKAAIRDFLEAARRQLGVTGPSDVTDEKVSSDEPWESKWFIATDPASNNPPSGLG
jgi:hypothetical protein